MWFMLHVFLFSVNLSEWKFRSQQLKGRLKNMHKVYQLCYSMKDTMIQLFTFYLKINQLAFNQSALYSDMKHKFLNA